VTLCSGTLHGEQTWIQDSFVKFAVVTLCSGTLHGEQTWIQDSFVQDRDQDSVIRCQKNTDGKKSTYTINELTSLSCA